MYSAITAETGPTVRATDRQDAAGGRAKVWSRITQHTLHHRNSQHVRPVCVPRWPMGSDSEMQEYAAVERDLRCNGARRLTGWSALTDLTARPTERPGRRVGRAVAGTLHGNAAADTADRTGPACAARRDPNCYRSTDLTSQDGQQTDRWATSQPAWPFNVDDQRPSRPITPNSHCIRLSATYTARSKPINWIHTRP